MRESRNETVSEKSGPKSEGPQRTWQNNKKGKERNRSETAILNLRFRGAEEPKEKQSHSTDYLMFAEGLRESFFGHINNRILIVF